MTETFSLLIYVLVLYLVSGLFAGSAAVATRSRPGALCAVDWLQDELPPGRSGLHDSTATHCVCTLWSSPITQPVRGARAGSGRSNDRVRYM